MSWLEVQIHCSDREVEHVSECLTRTGALAVSCFDAANDDILEPKVGEIKYWPNTRVVGLYDAEISAEKKLISSLRADLNLNIKIETSVLEEKDWDKEWVHEMQPISFGERLWVYPEHLEIPTDTIAVHLNPGLAFGTGTHATTRLCLNYLDAHPMPSTVIDYGCGSGILGIAAIKCGAQEVWAVDNDPQAIFSTHTNAAKNQITPEQLKAFMPDDFPEIKGDLILANILLAPLMFLRDSFAAHLKPEGLLVVSGLLETQTEQLAQHYEGIFVCDTVTVDEGWARMTFHLASSPPSLVSE